MSARHFTVDLGRHATWRTATVCLSNTLDRATLYADAALTVTLPNPCTISTPLLAFWVANDALVYDLLLSASERQIRVADIANLPSIPFHEYEPAWEDVERAWDWSFIHRGSTCPPQSFEVTP